MPDAQPADREPCAGSYSACTLPADVVEIRASGDHPTAGYQVSFQELPIDVYPPEFSLWHVKPSGAVPQVVTAFEETVRFDAPDPVSVVYVSDANGRHEVPVEEAVD